MLPNMLHPTLLLSASTSYNDFNINYPHSPPTLPNPAHHHDEIDPYITLQGEQLSMKLQQQVALILNAVELNILNSMRQKDEEISRAAKRSMELGDLLNRVEAENQAWQRAALESEAMMLSLNNTLEKMKEKAHCGSNNVWADDAQSCCGESGGDDDDDERIKREMAASACKSCDRRVSCLLFLPCRHLCACKACEPFLQACPVCTAPKKASIEALIF